MSHHMTPEQCLAGIARCEAERAARLAQGDLWHVKEDPCCSSCARGAECESTCDSPMLFNASCGTCPITPPELPPEF